MLKSKLFILFTGTFIAVTLNAPQVSALSKVVHTVHQSNVGSAKSKGGTSGQPKYQWARLASLPSRVYKSSVPVLRLDEVLGWGPIKKPIPPKRVIVDLPPPIASSWVAYAAYTGSSNSFLYIVVPKSMHPSTRSKNLVGADGSFGFTFLGSGEILLISSSSACIACTLGAAEPYFKSARIAMKKDYGFGGNVESAQQMGEHVSYLNSGLVLFAYLDKHKNSTYGFNNYTPNGFKNHPYGGTFGVDYTTTHQSSRSIASWILINLINQNHGFAK